MEKGRSKTNMLFAGIAALSAIVCFGQSRSALAADESESDPQIVVQKHHHKKHLKEAFKIGLCAGQILAGEGITLPAAVPGEKPNYDTVTKKALKKAVKECKAEIKKASDQSSSAVDDPSDSEEEEDTGFDL